MSTIWQIVYVSGGIAIAAYVISNRRRQRGILIQFHEWPLSFIITLLLPLYKAH